MTSRTFVQQKVSSPKIGYLSAGNPFNRKAWSGLHHSIYNHLQKHVGTVVALGPYDPKLQLFIGKCINQLTQKLLGKRYNYRHSAIVSRAYAKWFNRRIREEKPDLLVAVSASSELARVKTDLPVIYICDAIVHSSLNYYKTLTNLHEYSINESIETESLALKKSDLVVFAASWARDLAMPEVDKLIKRSRVIPFGPNFVPPSASELSFAAPAGTCNLLFVGVFWETKGAPVALECLKVLLEKGINARLVICGCNPPPNVSHPNMEVTGFLDKNNSADAQRLQQLYREAHFFILPTQFEAYGVVFCEAAAYGLPALGTRTGGVTDIIKEGVNGFLFEKKDQGHVYAEKIKMILSDPEGYINLRKSSRREFEKRLNWDHWAMEIKKEVKSLLYA
jgi:glycosyltransferase involved in cell wall biosynthesis